MGCTVDIAFGGAADARPMDGGGGGSAALGVTEVVGGARGSEVAGRGAVLGSEEGPACRNIAKSTPWNDVWFSRSRTDCWVVLVIRLFCADLSSRTS